MSSSLSGGKFLLDQVCTFTGAGVAGGTCTSNVDCGAGLMCSAKTCTPYCDAANPCATGTCTRFTGTGVTGYDTSLGYCAPTH